jgi:hypothetical protein
MAIVPYLATISYIHVGQKQHQSFDGKTFQAIFLQCRHFGLVDPEHFRRFGLRPSNATPCPTLPMLSVPWRSLGATTRLVSSQMHPRLASRRKFAIACDGKLDLGLALLGIRQVQVGKHVAGTHFNFASLIFCLSHNAPRSQREHLSIAV